MLTAAELQALARLEGRPLPRGRALEARLGLSPAAARRMIHRLRARGLLTITGAGPPPPGGCACVTYVHLDWTQARAEALEARFRDDPAVLIADRLLGPSDYRLFSRHADYRVASAWVRDLEAEPGVSRLGNRFCTLAWDRPHYAAARLASAGDCGGR